jgi:DNA-binding IclR family transcriptional regulator
MAKTIQSVERAMRILFYLSDSPGRQFGTLELSEALSLHPSTVSRLLTTLKRTGIITQDPVSKQYGLGVRILELAHAVTSQLDLVNVARPHMSQLVSQFQESTYVVVLDGIDSVTVGQVTAVSRSSSTRPAVGRRVRAHGTSGGKMLLAHSPDRAVEELIQAGLEQFTPYTIVHSQELRAELQRIRQQGYSIANQELEIGLVAVGAGIYSYDNRMLGAVSISGPPERFSPDRLPEFITAIRETARRISVGLGWKAPSEDETQTDTLLPAVATPIEM